MKKNDPIKSPKKAETIANPAISRRDFFSMAWKGLGILAGLEVAGMVIAYFFSGKDKTADGALPGH